MKFHVTFYFKVTESLLRCAKMCPDVRLRDGGGNLMRSNMLATAHLSSPGCRPKMVKMPIAVLCSTVRQLEKK